MTDSITDRQAKYNKVVKAFLHGISEVNKNDKRQLVYLLHKKGATLEEIGKAINLSKQRVLQIYPELKGGTVREQ